jgi:hypothetical protein
LQKVPPLGQCIVPCLAFGVFSLRGFAVALLLTLEHVLVESQFLSTFAQCQGETVAHRVCANPRLCSSLPEFNSSRRANNL